MREVDRQKIEQVFSSMSFAELQQKLKEAGLPQQEEDDALLPITIKPITVGYGAKSVYTSWGKSEKIYFGAPGVLVA